MSQVQEIKEKLDIVDVIGERLSLQRSGKNMRGVCPFHSEKTPSFFVSPELQSFICFGCGKKGDVFTFIQEFERLTFPESMEILASKAGIELKQEGHDPQESARRRTLEILAIAQQFYHYLLTKHTVAEPARAYLKERGLQNSTLKQFGLGFAPDGWDNLLNYLTKKKKFSLNDIDEAGLLVKGQKGKYYDRFRNRIMFPLHDHRGRVVGFSGRLMDSTAKEAKYINTPETAVYHKRYLLYGYSQNLEAIREKESVIIMEGEFDVLSSLQAHVKNVVAIKGSALTTEQIRILARTAKTIYLALDADNAGIAATSRAIELVQPFPVSLRVIPLTGGKDPDQLALHGPGAWKDMTQNHVSAFEYVLETTMRQHDTKTADGLKKVTDTLLSLLLTIDHAVERSFYLKQLAEKLNISPQTLEEQWATLRRKAEAQRTIKSTRDSESKTPEKKQATDTSGNYFWQLALRIKRIPKEIQALDASLFEEPAHQRLAQLYKKTLAQGAEFSLEEFSRNLPAELKELVTTLYIAEIPGEESEWERELILVYAQLQQRHNREKRQQIADDLAKLEAKKSLTTAEQAEYEQLQKMFLQLPF